jgi:hypothetical protein
LYTSPETFKKAVESDPNGGLSCTAAIGEKVVVLDRDTLVVNGRTRDFVMVKVTSGASAGCVGWVLKVLPPSKAAGWPLSETY